jgi:hypothetical protein
MGGTNILRMNGSHGGSVVNQKTAKINMGGSFIGGSSAVGMKSDLFLGS